MGVLQLLFYRRARAEQFRSQQGLELQKKGCPFSVFFLLSIADGMLLGLEQIPSDAEIRYTIAKLPEFFQTQQ